MFISCMWWHIEVCSACKFSKISNRNEIFILKINTKDDNMFRGLVDLACKRKKTLKKTYS